MHLFYCLFEAFDNLPDICVKDISVATLSLVNKLFTKHSLVFEEEMNHYSNISIVLYSVYALSFCR